MSPPPQRARALAPAKINAWLDVRGRRPDGFHEIASLLVALDICDEIDVARDRSGDVSLRVEGPAATPDVPADERNLAWRAARGVLDRARAAGAVARDTGLAVALVKRIPSQAGLGGGSSDAAAAIAASERALGFDLGAAAGELAADLGSDCAFFNRAAATGVALCSGRGERVEPRPPIDPAWRFAVLTPAAACSTSAVYAAYAAGLSGRASPPSLRPDVFALEPPQARAALHNALEGAALAVAPVLASWRALLARADAAHFALAGSGSSFFGIYRDPAAAGEALERIVSKAREAGLGVRFTGVARPAGHGARVQSCD